MFSIILFACTLALTCYWFCCLMKSIFDDNFKEALALVGILVIAFVGVITWGTEVIQLLT